jgi:antitoxin component YwqK of YwqJK toxin-antitoxin module
MRFSFTILLLSFGFIHAIGQSDTIFNQTDAGNLRQGWWKKTYPNGKLMYTGFFKNNNPVGKMLRFYESGVLKAEMDYNQTGNYAHARLFYENGQMAAEGCYFNTLKDSTWKYYSYYDTSLTVKETYVRGARNGLMIHYYSNGSISEKLEWKNNKKDGIWEQYFINNIPKLKGQYVNDHLQGEFQINYGDGKPYLKGKYLNDRRDGQWIFYKEDGTIDMELQYISGKTKDEDKLNEKQQEIFRMIDENQGKFEEPDETNFLNPSGK